MDEAAHDLDASGVTEDRRHFVRCACGWQSSWCGSTTAAWIEFTAHQEQFAIDDERSSEAN